MSIELKATTVIAGYFTIIALVYKFKRKMLIHSFSSEIIKIYKICTKNSKKCSLIKINMITVLAKIHEWTKVVYNVYFLNKIQNKTQERQCLV